MNYSPTDAMSSPNSATDQLLHMRQDLYEYAGQVLEEVERKKGALTSEIYVEMRRYLNSVNDALARSAEAADGGRWEAAKESAAWADTLLAYIKTALAKHISVSDVLDQWRRKSA